MHLITSNMGVQHESGNIYVCYVLQMNVDFSWKEMVNISELMVWWNVFNSSQPFDLVVAKW